MTFATSSHNNFNDGCGITSSSGRFRASPTIIRLAKLLFYALLASNVVDASSSASVNENTTGKSHQCGDKDGVCMSSSDQANVPNIQQNRVSDECTLVMAPSGLENGGWGIFTLTPRIKDEVLNQYGDVVIQITDPNPHTAAGMRRLVWDYLWEGQLLAGHYEGFQRVYSAVPGIGSLANGRTKGYNAVGGYPAVGNLGLDRVFSPGAGAFTHYENYTWTASKDLDAGDEIFISYGEHWMNERSLTDGTAWKRDVSDLRQFGYCLDNIIPGTSLIEHAGRGAFASRDLEQDSIIAPVPLLSLSRSSLEILKERQDGTVEKATQLLLNYCYGHANSSTLLFPYSNGVNMVNHHSAKANVKLRWLEGSELIPHSLNAKYMLEMVALRDISKGEEIYLDYGSDWEEAWKTHVDNWRPDPVDVKHYAHKMNTDANFSVIRTLEEQETNPYPDSIFTSCYYKLEPNAIDKLKTTKQSVGTYNPSMIAPRNLRPCLVIQRRELPASSSREGKEEHNAMAYTVHVLNRPTLDAAQRIPRGHRHFVNVPRNAILFSEKTYTSDQHLVDAFRKEIGLGDASPSNGKTT
jgi:hypothetical protein